MEKDIIKDYLKKIEEDTKSKVILYFTNDLVPPFATQVYGDVIPLIKAILETQSHVEKRTLILNTNGGALEAVWPIVSLIREYTSGEFNVIVPSKALSAGTLISLGADNIIMRHGSFLSPIDPTGTFVVNKGGSIQNKQCSVEDVMGFISFAKKKVGLKDQSALIEILKLITEGFDASIIGSVNRTHSLIRNLAKKLIGTRKDKSKLNKSKVDLISKNLIEELFSHNHMVSFDEAKTIGLDYVKRPSQSLHESVSALYNYYKNDLYLEEKGQEIDNMVRATTSVQQNLNIIGACVHSIEMSYNFASDISIANLPNPAGTINPVMTINKQSWLKYY